MVTASQQKLIDEIGELLREEGRVEVAWLAGSLGRGQGDTFSDVDLLVLVEDGTLIEVSSALVAVEPEMPYRPAPQQLLKLVQEFIRVLGLAVVVVGREEYTVALSGIEHLRRMTLDLMMEENRVAPGRRGGALHRNSLLNAEQRAQLESLPPLVAERASVIEGHQAFAEVFLPRARRLAAEIGMVWPSDFEAATRRHLEANLQLRI